MSYATQSTEKSIRSVKGDAYVTARVKLPFTGKTRDEVLGEFRQNPDLFSVMNEQLEIATNGGLLRVADAEFKLQARLQTTRRLRQMIRPDLLETIERASTSILATEFADLIRAEISDFVLYRTDCAGSAPSVSNALPDCAFDEAFGFPCSNEQSARAKEAMKSGDTVAY